MAGTRRSISKQFPAQPTSDGAGVNLRRSIGAPQLDHLDPFLLLDSIASDAAADYIAGFPEHPHRGFETVTYMLEGRMRHRDSGGNEGVLRSGSAQWMTAGRGVIHSEMPEQEEGRLHGFQLWVNLPSASKMIPARYQNIEPEEIPEVDLGGGGRVRVVAGEAYGRTGPISGIDVDPLFLDVKLAAGQGETFAVPDGHTAFVYAIAGAVSVESDTGASGVLPDTLAILGPGDEVRLTAEGGDCHALLVAGRPIGEPVARYGPFVMNTRAELMKAVEDFQNGTFL